jgi:hypothetical protein
MFDIKILNLEKQIKILKSKLEILTKKNHQLLGKINKKTVRTNNQRNVFQNFIKQDNCQIMELVVCLFIFLNYQFLNYF